MSRSTADSGEGRSRRDAARHLGSGLDQRHARRQRRFRRAVGTEPHPRQYPRPEDGRHRADGERRRLRDQHAPGIRGRDHLVLAAGRAGQVAQGQEGRGRLAQHHRPRLLRYIAKRATSIRSATSRSSPCSPRTRSRRSSPAPSTAALHPSRGPRRRSARATCCSQAASPTCRSCCRSARPRRPRGRISATRSRRSARSSSRATPRRTPLSTTIPKESLEYPQEAHAEIHPDDLAGSFTQMQKTTPRSPVHGRGAGARAGADDPRRHDQGRREAEVLQRDLHQQVHQVARWRTVRRRSVSSAPYRGYSFPGQIAPFGLPIILIGAVVVIVIVMFGLAARDEDRWGDAW